MRGKIAHICGVVALTLAAMTPAFGGTVDWTTWTSESATTVTGSTTVGGQTVTVTYTGEFENTANTTELNGSGINYYTPASTYTNTTVSNLPISGNMIAIDGTDTLHTITFSSPVTNPVMAIVSLGQGGVATTYAFDAPFTILSQGPGYWGSCYSTCLTASGDSLTGTEGDGVIQFQGTFTSISWTGSNPESWNGFTFGVMEPTSTVPEPSSFLLLGSGLTGLMGLWRRKVHFK